jgi:hypothetical protein
MKRELAKKMLALCTHLDKIHSLPLHGGVGFNLTNRTREAGQREHTI